MKKNFGYNVQTPTYEYCSYLSPDHHYFFYSSRRDVKWTSVQTLPEPMRSLIKRQE